MRDWRHSVNGYRMKELRHPQVRDTHRGERLPNDKIQYGTVRSDHGCVKKKKTKNRKTIFKGF
jgi:hypothetical protein